MTEYLVMRPDERVAYEAWCTAHPHRAGSAQQRAFIAGHRSATGAGTVSLMWSPRCHSVQVRLKMRGVDRDVIDVDNAIQSAREALKADDEVWYDPDTTHGWEVLEPHVLRFLDLSDDELQAVA